MIRKAKISDMDGIVQLGLEALNNDAYEKLVIDHEKLINVARTCISSATNFAYVCEKDGEIKGAVLALVHPMLFYRRSQATVVMFYCKEPGQGAKLIRVFLRWARNRPIIKMIVFTLESRADPRIGKLLDRFGVHEELPVFLETR